METWVKKSKVMPLSPHSILQEREGSLTAKHDSGRTHFSIPHLLKLHLKKFQNFFFDLNLQQIMQILHNSPILVNSSTLASILSDC